MWRDSLAVTVKKNQKKKTPICGFNYGSCKKKGTVLASWGKVLHTMPSLIYN